MKKSQYESTSPPGGDVGGPDLKRRPVAQGYGGTAAEIRRGFAEPKVSPEPYEDPHPQRGDPWDSPAGDFFRRTGVPDER